MLAKEKQNFAIDFEPSAMMFGLETGFPITAVCAGCPDANLFPPKDASGMPVPGWNVTVLNEAKEPAKPGELGRIVAK